MNFNEYRPLALRTASRLPSSRDDFDHAMLGIITENGEFATEIKRVVAYGRAMTDDMCKHCIEESGDTFWYVPLAMLALKIDDLPELNDDDLLAVWPFTASLSSVARGIGMLSGALIALVEDGSLDSTEAAHLLAMIVYLLDAAAPMLGTTPDEVRAQNINKLRKRYPDAFSNEAAEARADKGGLDARNS